VVNFNLAAESPVQPGGPFTDGDVRDIHLELPPGLIENPAAVPQCSQAQFHTLRQSPFETSFSGESCPDRSQIGVVGVHSSFGGGTTRYFGVFNLTPPPGVPSELGFNPYGAPITFMPNIRQAGGEYGLTLSALNIPQVLDLYGLELTIWGTPWNIVHNNQRGNCLNEIEPAFGWAKCSIGQPKFNPGNAYLTLPTSCVGPMVFSVSADSWQQPALVFGSSISHDESGHPQSLEGCGLLAFEPQPSVQLTDPRASSASGLAFNLDVDDSGVTNPQRLAPSSVKKAVLALPEGMTINPSVAAGLGVCTPAQYAAETVSSAPGAGCPNASKIGDFTVQSPLFETPVSGALFLAEPDNPATTAPGAENPFDSLLALYLVAKAPERGVLVKVAGKVSVDPGSGRLIATFDDLPQLPYSDLKIHFREGQRSLLATPAACGGYTAQIDLTPWLDPSTIRHNTSQFQIASGIGGGPCPSGAAPPFVPQAKAGTLNSNAGSYSPFYLHLTRTDAEQEITSYSATLPPGLLGKIADIPYCPDADIEAAKRESGTEESEHPSCPAASEIGHTESGYGLGTVLAYAPGRLYLAGPYHGSSFSIVAIDSATVGPFDLGTIIVRSAIKVGRQTAQVSIDSAGSDPIPHIIDGIPIHLRDIRVYIDRPDFTLNPTNCDPFAISSTLTGSSAPFSNPKDVSALATDPFQVAFCSSLGFAPRLSLRLRGPTKRGDYPSLRAVVRPRSGDANIGRVAVTLPPSEFLAQNHIGTICTHSQFEREACPARSVYGHARAITPLLGKPLDGPVYLRSSDNPLPDLVAALRGGGNGIAIDVVGRIDSSHRGIRGSFDVLPDAPVTRFTMTLKGGKRGVLVNAADVCAAPQFATVLLIGNNNSGEALRPRLGAGCAKHNKGGKP
jgi:hypothetical protein